MRTKSRTNSERALRKKKGRPTEIDRSALLDAAEVLFSEKGFEGATTRELVRRAGCNVALISYYFGGKEGLYQAMMVRYFERLRNRYTSIEECPEALEKAWPELKECDQRFFCAALFELAQSILSDSRMQKVICREMMAGAEKMATVIRKSESGVYKLLARRIEALQASGRIRKDLDLCMSALGLVGPMIYSCIASPLLREIYGLNTSEVSYTRRLCLHQTRVFFEGCGV